MKRVAAFTAIAIALATLCFAADEYTRGVGVYPGNPDEDLAPVLVPDSATYRNLALLRPAYHSSSYDYNLTAQLVMDGMKETVLPRWLVTSLSTSGVTNKIERKRRQDSAGAVHRQLISLLPGEQRSIQIQIHNADTRGEKPAVVVQGFNVQQ